jgi:glycosyltransferase involved in cell wall biosynthesis
MKTVALLAYHFPPLGGAGVQRSLKFARYLPEHGYRPLVITGPGRADGRWTPADETLLAELPDVRVVRVPGPEPVPPGRWRGRAERWLGAAAAWDRWWVEGAGELVARHAREADVVLASMSPFQSAAAARAAAAAGRPWVADLRDPWALDEMTIYPSRAHRRAALRRMGRDLSAAAAIIANTPDAARAIATAFPGLAGRPLEAIPNGYDAADFAGPDPSRPDSRFRVVHAGYLHTGLGRSGHGAARRLLGGAIADVDILARSHVHLVAALERVAAEDPGLAATIELHLAGVVSPADREALGTAVAVCEHGYLEHSRSVGLMRSADLLFLPMHDVAWGHRARIVPGKTYEYLASGRPILAAVPDGDARDLLARAPQAHLCRPTDVVAMAEIIRCEAAARRLGGPAPTMLLPDLLARYERRRLAGRLAAVLDAVTGSPGRRGATPRSAAASAV